MHLKAHVSGKHLKQRHRKSAHEERYSSISRLRKYSVIGGFVKYRTSAKAKSSSTGKFQIINVNFLKHLVDIVLSVFLADFLLIKKSAIILHVTFDWRTSKNFCLNVRSNKGKIRKRKVFR